VTAGSAAVFFFARVAHAIVHIAGIGVARARTLLFTVAWMAFIAFAIEVLRRA